MGKPQHLDQSGLEDGVLRLAMSLGGIGGMRKSWLGKSGQE